MYGLSVEGAGGGRRRGDGGGEGWVKMQSFQLVDMGEREGKICMVFFEGRARTVLNGA